MQTFRFLHFFIVIVFDFRNLRFKNKYLGFFMIDFKAICGENLLMNIGEEIGKKLRELREQRKMTQAAAGKVIGVSPSAISNKEAGKSDLTPEELQKLAQLYGVTVGWLFGENIEGGYGPDVQRLIRLYMDSSEVGQGDILKIAIDAYLENQ
jgi:transcriptional regulator with XRE-family HTH domain